MQYPPARQNSNINTSKTTSCRAQTTRGFPHLKRLPLFLSTQNALKAIDKNPQVEMEMPKALEFGGHHARLLKMRNPQGVRGEAHLIREAQANQYCGSICEDFSVLITLGDILCFTFLCLIITGIFFLPLSFPSKSSWLDVLSQTKNMERSLSDTKREGGGRDGHGICIASTTFSHFFKSFTGNKELANMFQVRKLRQQ